MEKESPPSINCADRSPRFVGKRELHIHCEKDVEI